MDPLPKGWASPAIHVFRGSGETKDVDARVKPGQTSFANDAPAR